jgi:hypothetical protein
MRTRNLARFVFLLVVLGGAGNAAASLDLTYRHVGISLGNAPRVIGLRVNGVDADVRRVDGLNLTLWNPRPSPEATFNGAAVGLIGPKAGRLHGLAFGTLGATAAVRIRGLAAAGFGVGTRRLEGIALGGLLTKVESGSRGLAISLVSCQGKGELRGLAFGGAVATVDSTRGLLVGGLAAAGRRLDGIGLSLGVVAADERLRGLGVGGLVVGGCRQQGVGLSAGAVIGTEALSGIEVGGLAVIAGESLSGVAVSVGATGAGKDLRGIAVGGLGVGARKSMRGLAVGGLVALAERTHGVSFGLLNGVIVDDINLEDFLRIRTVNRHYTGLSLGLVNYSAELNGVQIGLLNYARNNPRWARLLPGLNLHL